MANNPLLGSFGDISGSGLMFRNKLINGGFDIWQRGTSSTATIGYRSADRWEIWNPNTNTTRNSFTLGQTTVPNNPKYYMTVARTIAASSDNIILSQKIESPENFTGQTVTASFWAKAAVSKNIQVDFWAAMNSAEVLDSDQGSIGLTTSWQKFTFTITLPNFASGKTSTANDWIAFRFLELSGFSAFTIDIAQVQVEFGAVASPFEQRPIGTELALCQRYHQEFGVLNASMRIGSTNELSIYITPRVPMRATASLSVRLANADYVVGSPSGNQWSLVRPGVAFANKSGTVSWVTDGTIHGTFGGAFTSTGATFDANAVMLVCSGTSGVSASAEL